MNQRAAGLTLIELMISMALMGVGVLAVAPMFVQSMSSNATSADFGRVGALAVGQMESLRSTPYGSLSPGGSLATNTSGYFSQPQPDVLVRWQVVDNSGVVAGTKILTVRAVTLNKRSGPRREATLSTLRGD